MSGCRHAQTLHHVKGERSACWCQLPPGSLLRATRQPGDFAGGPAAMLLTLGCITVVLASPFAVGLPLSWLLNGRQPLSSADWIRAPFLGVAAIVVVLQNLVVL